AVSGLSVVGRDRYGVFPLKGKFLNVRNAAQEKQARNKEFGDIKTILGLQMGKEYTDASELRYGHVMLFCDADLDGHHITSLIVNMFARYWPSLLKLPGFLQKFVTPIVKVTKGKQSISFYTLAEYEAWKALGLKGWTVKYYKGLG